MKRTWLGKVIQVVCVVLVGLTLAFGSVAAFADDPVDPPVATTD